MIDMIIFSNLENDIEEILDQPERFETDLDFLMTMTETLQSKPMMNIVLLKISGQSDIHTLSEMQLKQFCREYGRIVAKIIVQKSSSDARYH